jgi:hypothetical protein
VKESLDRIQIQIQIQLELELELSRAYALRLPCALGVALICPPCSCTSQQRTPESQFPETKMLDVGLQERLLIPSFPADGTLQSVGAIDEGRAAAPPPAPKADIVLLVRLLCLV